MGNLSGYPDKLPIVVYEEVLDLIVVAEELGYHSARVTQHHFGERYGRLPSPLPFLVTAAERTKHIRLTGKAGTHEGYPYETIHFPTEQNSK